MAERGLGATGYDEVSLASLSCGDYRRLELLLAELMARYSGEKEFQELASRLMSEPLVGEVSCRFGHHGESGG